MARFRVRSDAFKLMKMAHVILACEIKGDRYDNAFRDAARHNSKKVLFEKYAVQMAVPKDMEISWVKTVKLTDGVKGINPSRFLQLAFNAEEREIYAITHMTNAAWGRTIRRGRALRRRLWLAQERKIRETLAPYVAKGWTIYIGGDMNTGRYRNSVNFHKNQRVMERRGLMWLLVIPGQGAKTLVTARKVVGSVFTDHPFIRATGTTTR